MFSKIGIKNFYKSEIKNGDYKIKENIENFIVYEINKNGISSPGPILNLDKFYDSKNIFKQIPETVSKDKRKFFYDSTKYYPFLKLGYFNDKFTIKPNEKDIFVCTLMKYNLNMVDAVKIIAKNLNVSSQYIQFSGNKDKKAITFQEISINCSFEKLFSYCVALNKNNISLEYADFKKFDDENLKIINVMVEEGLKIEKYNVSDRIRIFNIRKGSSIKMGEHIGNKFIIKIKDLTEINYKPFYFLNYFGQQRFGKNLNNHIVGELILESKYDEALDVILQDNFIESKLDIKNNFIESKLDIKDSFIQKYIKKMREKNVSSKNIIYKMDRLNRMMYMHAYQSYLFNLEVNKRIENNKIESEDLIFEDGKFIKAKENSQFEDIYIPLTTKADKFLKGGQRKMIEELKDFNYKKDKENMILSFSLNKSSYATCALREIIGNYF